MSIAGKKLMLLVLLLVFLCLLVFYYMNNVANKTDAKEQAEVLQSLPASEKTKDTKNERFNIYYYQITKIDGNSYKAKTKEGTSITFTTKSLEEPLSDKLAEGDIIKAYFDKKVPTNGLYKVEKR
ncbi:hypothetical protein [Priestia filamentosa]|uniref:Uncharacterized protein n=1 Tax=Priestia filamentosa TaxID=1402861 RepID=A0A1X7G518_9BACI|nr:hypothetical protein [Priestia filamentosa]AKO92052.1 hypothetical protein BEH_08045 [Priestia filamentosa]MDT3762054.1 hypothetical protein [Priestia filamentosa]MED3726240.1 hypothetical protein [Priestia filamentosa]OXS65963.1 hypothetical protein B1B01_21175 [Priestia filamentosa]RJS64665.1 hypothetical protein CJ485_07855 [Priestia filamentosa]